MPVTWAILYPRPDLAIADLIEELFLLIKLTAYPRLDGYWEEFEL